MLASFYEPATELQERLRCLRENEREKCKEYACVLLSLSPAHCKRSALVIEFRHETMVERKNERGRAPLGRIDG